jgi:transposase
MQIATIGLDIAKNVFQVHGIDVDERILVRKQLRRRQVPEFFKALAPCLVGMEAVRHCSLPGARTHEAWSPGSTDAGEELKAYVKRNKNDAADAEAIQLCAACLDAASRH